MTKLSSLLGLIQEVKKQCEEDKNKNANLEHMVQKQEVSKSRSAEEQKVDDHKSEIKQVRNTQPKKDFTQDLNESDYNLSDDESATPYDKYEDIYDNAFI